MLNRWDSQSGGVPATINRWDSQSSAVLAGLNRWWDNSQSNSSASSDREADEDSWSVGTVVEVLELDCEGLSSGQQADISLPDRLLLFCLLCLLIRVVQVLVELFLSNFSLQKELTFSC